MLYQLPHGTNPGGMKKIAGALNQSQWQHNNLLVSECQKSTSTQVNSSKTNSRESKTSEMQQRLIPINYQNLISCVEDFLAKHSQSLEKGKVWKIPAVQCFLRLQEYLGLKDLNICSSKMSRGYYLTRRGRPRLLNSSEIVFKSWGMRFNGWYLTASFSESPRTERGYSLSEVLETNPDQKYYLSEKAVQGLMRAMKRNHKPTFLQQSTEELEQEHITHHTSQEQSSHQTEKTKDKTEEESKILKNQCLL